MFRNLFSFLSIDFQLLFVLRSGGRQENSGRAQTDTEESTAGHGFITIYEQDD